VPNGAKRRAIICDIDNTICTAIDQPIVVACELLARLDPSIEVHYVTGRPEELREDTQRFLAACRLPCPDNLHLCPSGLWKSIREHKAEVIQRLAQVHDVIVSVGDSTEEQEASLAAGVHFLRITEDNVETIWAQVAELLGAYLEELEA
jgi:hypothetical protein